LTDWEAIVRRHGPMAFDTAARILGHAADTEDAVQEALLDAFRLHRRKPVANWGGLLRHLATCRALDKLRRRRAEARIEGDLPSPVSSQPEPIAIQRELANRLRRSISRLPDREAVVFALRFFGELSNAEIAETLGISVNATAVALHKARSRLARLLGYETERPRRAGP